MDKEIGMNPRWRSYLNHCRMLDKKPTYHEYIIFLGQNIAEFSKQVDRVPRAPMTDSEEEQFLDFLCNKYPEPEEGEQ